MQQSDIPQPVTNDELQQAVDVLAKFEPGYLPFPLFMAIARLVVFSIIEVVPVRRTPEDTVEVLLIQRPSDDPLWPSMWHNPGVVVLASDTPGTYADPYARIMDELGVTDNLSEPTFVGLSFHKTRRGTDAAMIHYLELPTGFTPAHGVFFSADNLPQGIIESNEPLIRQAISAFQNA